MLLKKLLDKHYWRAVLILTRTALHDQYRNSFLGILWSLVQPLVQVAVLCTVFSIIWKLSAKDYFIYLVSGLLTWQFMVAAINKGASSICTRRDVFHHTVISKSMFVIADVLTQFYLFVISFGTILLIVLALKGIHLNLLLLPLLLLPLVVFILGASIASAYLSAYVWDIPHLIGMAFTVLFWTVPIVYPIDVVPEMYREYFLYNPFYLLIHPVQQLLYSNEVPDMQMYMLAWAVAGAAMLLAYGVFRRFHRNVIYYL